MSLLILPGCTRDITTRHTAHEGILPIQSTSDSIRGLAIRQVLHELEHRDQCQAPRRLSGLAVGGKQISKRFIGLDRTKRVTQLHEHIATGKDGASYSRCFFGNGWNGCWFQ